MEHEQLLQRTYRKDQAPTREEPSGESEAVPSPFLEGTWIQYAWDSTSLGAFKKCPRYYQLKILMGWTALSSNIHLRWGQEFHSALEDYDRSRFAGVNHDDSIHDTIRALLGRIEDWEPEPEKKSEELKSKEALVRAVVDYLDKYEDDPAKTVRLANGKPAVEVSFSFGLEFIPHSEKARNDYLLEVQNYVLCGHLDRIVEFSGGLYVMDRKTTTQTPGSYFFDKFHPDNQMTLYTLAGQIILGSPIRGVIIDAIQVLTDSVRPTRGFTYRTADQLEEWLEDTKHWLRQAEGCATDGHWPMNDTACDKFGGCEFRGICSKSPGVREKFLEGGFRKEEPWNPLKPR